MILHSITEGTVIHTCRAQSFSCAFWSILDYTERIKGRFPNLASADISPNIASTRGQISSLDCKWNGSPFEIFVSWSSPLLCSHQIVPYNLEWLSKGPLRCLINLLTQVRKITPTQPRKTEEKNSSKIRSSSSTFKGILSTIFGNTLSSVVQFVMSLHLQSTTLK